MPNTAVYLLTYPTADQNDESGQNELASRWRTLARIALLSKAPPFERPSSPAC